MLSIEGSYSSFFVSCSFFVCVLEATKGYPVLSAMLSYVCCHHIACLKVLCRKDRCKKTSYIFMNIKEKFPMEKLIINEFTHI
jgi:hypothetical protein